MIWKLFGRQKKYPRPKEVATDDEVISSVGSSWDYYTQYVDHKEKNTTEMIEYFRDAKRNHIRLHYSSHENLPDETLDLLIYRGIQDGSWDGVKDDVQNCLDNNFLSKVKS